MMLYRFVKFAVLVCFVSGVKNKRISLSDLHIDCGNIEKAAQEFNFEIKEKPHQVASSDDGGAVVTYSDAVEHIPNVKYEDHWKVDDKLAKMLDLSAEEKMIFLLYKMIEFSKKNSKKLTNANCMKSTHVEDSRIDVLDSVIVPKASNKKYKPTPLKKILKSFLKSKLKKMSKKNYKAAKKLIKKFKKSHKVEKFICLAYLIQTHETLMRMWKSCQDATLL